MTQSLVLSRREPAPLAFPVTERLAYLSGKADDYAERDRAESTKKTYEKERASFRSWCEAHGLASFPAESETVRQYVVHCAERGRKPRGISVACAAIRAEHYDAGRFDPTAHPDVKRTISGIRNVHGVAAKKKRALAVAQLRAISAAIPDGPTGIRDRALILIGFAGAFRRAALAALKVENIEDHESGIRVYIGRDKTDQTAKGRWIVVPFGEHHETCPVLAFRAWAALLGRSSGPLFVGFRSGRRTTKPLVFRTTALSPGIVAEIVKTRCLAAGIDPKDFAGHSLRSGLATAAARAGKRLDKIMAQTGHVKIDTVLGYIQDAEMGDENNAARGIGL